MILVHIVWFPEKSSSVQFPYNPVVGYFHETAYDNNDHLIGWYFHTHSSHSFYVASVSYYSTAKPTEGCRVHFRCVDYCFGSNIHTTAINVDSEKVKTATAKNHTGCSTNKKCKPTCITCIRCNTSWKLKS